MRIPMSFLVCLAAFCAACASAAPSKPTPRFQRIGADRGYVWLRSAAGTDFIRDPRGHQAPTYEELVSRTKTVSLVNGVQVDFQPKEPPYGIAVRRGARTVGAIGLTAQVEKWMDDDDFWGGHAAANQARYLASRAGVPWFFTDGSAAGKSAVAILRFYNAGASSHAQHLLLEWLVKIDVEPKPRLSLLRRLNPSGGTANNPSLRTIRVHGTTYLIDPPGLFVLDASGKLGAKRASLPDGYEAQNLVEGRHLLFAPERYGALHLKRLDLAGKQRAARSLPGPWEGAEHYELYHSRHSPWVAVRWTRAHYSDPRRLTLVNVRTAKLRTVPAAAGSTGLSLWGDRLIERTGAELNVFHIPTGNRLATMKEED